MNHASNMTNVDSAGSETPAELRTLYLAGGCFWGLEAYLKRLPGVRGTVVGYANGSTENPSYYDVCRWNTGHAETVAVTYDPRVLPTDVLLDAFFEAIDPTSVDCQGNDRGTQYRSGIYWTDEADLTAIEASLLRQQARYTSPIVTEVEPLDGFYPAEEYHQNYLEKNPGGYCHIDVRSADAFAERMGLEEGRACVQVDGLCEPLALGEGAATAGAVEREDIPHAVRIASCRRAATAGAVEPRGHPPRRPYRVVQTGRATKTALQMRTWTRSSARRATPPPPTTSCAACCRPTSTALRA